MEREMLLADLEYGGLVSSELFVHGASVGTR